MREAITSSIPPTDSKETPASPTTSTSGVASTIYSLPKELPCYRDGMTLQELILSITSQAPSASQPTSSTVQTDTTSPRQETILDEVKRIVHGGREEHYGHPKENFQRIAGLWTSYLGYPISLTDVANLMVLVKIARLQNSPTHKDSIMDIAGYAAALARAVGIDD